MTAVYAVGLGFRKACTAETLVALVRQALTQAAGVDPAILLERTIIATIAEKDRPVLHVAAHDLGLGVVILDKDAMAGTKGRITVVSEKARACFGIASVAEAAALAAAGPGARLIVPRLATRDATCAVARSEKVPS